jgi:FtsZ-binding cell division protein ZapB
MPAPFQPLGEQARWKTIYEILKAAPMNGVVTYTQLATALDLDPLKERQAIQQAMQRAAREHEALDKRAIDAVRGEGYRIVEPREHLDLARRHQRKSSRALVRGHSKAVNVNLNGVEPQVRAALETVGRAFALQMDFNHRFDVRQTRLEEVVRAIADSQHDDRKRTTEEVAELRERLARLEAGQQ